MKRYRLILTEKQLDIVTAALFEWSGLCEGEAVDIFGNYRKNCVLVKAAKEMDKVSTSIHKQIDKQK